MKTSDFEQTNWWMYLDDQMKDLVKQSIELLETEKKHREAGEVYYDYSFVIFPIAKAYEGFLKKLLLDMRLITPPQYYGEHFRIGRALSPTLPKRYRSGWVYGRLVKSCGGESLPMQMWEVWKEVRNKMFHYFPNRREILSLDEAELDIEKVISQMGKSLEGCKLSGGGRFAALRK